MLRPRFTNYKGLIEKKTYIGLLQTASELQLKTYAEVTSTAKFIVRDPRS